MGLLEVHGPLDENHESDTGPAGKIISVLGISLLGNLHEDLESAAGD